MSRNPLNQIIQFFLLIILCIFGNNNCNAQHPGFKVLVVASADHDPMIKQSKAFLEKIGAENNFEVDFITERNKCVLKNSP